MRSSFQFAPISPPPQPVPYRLFISHAWDYADEYDGVVRLLNSYPGFSWEDLSIPIENPVKMSPSFPKSYRRIVREIEERIKQSDCLLVLAGMYVHHSGWIHSEIEVAEEYQKPIIAVRPQGQERFPLLLTIKATQEVGWNSRSIVAAIRAYATPTGAPSAPGPLHPALRNLIPPPFMAARPTLTDLVSRETPFANMPGGIPGGCSGEKSNMFDTIPFLNYYNAAVKDRK